MRAQIETLDLLSNNLANAATNGYKADQEFFRQFVTALAEPGARGGDVAWMPVVQGSVTDFQQGPIQATQAPLDVALSGPGFLVAEGPSGPLYTRSGSLTLSSQGELKTADGWPVLDPRGRPITLPRAGQIEISQAGVVSVDGVRFAQLGVVEFAGPPPLAKFGRNYFQAGASATPQPAASTLVYQGSLEGSNVSAPLAAVRLIQAGRHFQMLSRAASLVDSEMTGRAVQELGRTGG